MKDFFLFLTYMKPPEYRITACARSWSEINNQMSELFHVFYMIITRWQVCHSTTLLVYNIHSFSYFLGQFLVAHSHERLFYF